MKFGTANRGRKIVVSGTYGVGKTTTTKELAKQVMMPLAVARGMRDILPETFPGKKLEECSPYEIVQLGMIRFAERRTLEGALPIGYISDGSALHEWAYGEGRKAAGANGRGSEITDPGYAFAIGAFGDVVKRYAKSEYTDVVHLPVEFPLPQDGHRPVSEEFRNHADKLILETWNQLGKKVHVIGGPTVESRVEKIIEALGLEKSPTANNPLDAGEGRIWYNRIEDALGPQEGRYFSNGFRKPHHFIYDVLVDPTNGVITAKADLTVPSNWSMKGGKVCEKHFTSVDSILILGQLTQTLMYAQDGITRERSNNLWLRELNVNPGRKPIENLDGIPVTVKQTKNKVLKGGWQISDVHATIGEEGAGFTCTASVGYQLPKIETPVISNTEKISVSA